jgi:vancomycin resistance protein YoaR
VNTLQPEITSEKADSLGINALLGKGESNFAGSPAARTNNIKVGAKTFNGLLLKSGEELSFNNLLGTVDDTTGYQPELVIKNNKLIPEFGGGICQVSTTLFRAAMDAGLPILERRSHSLPVKYYNPQGYDAAVYIGSVDLKFKNDTEGTVLIQSKIVGTKLYFEIYGTEDGRKVAINGPSQYDIKPDGSMKAVISRTVTYPDGTEKKDTFRSVYKSPGLFPTVRNPLE